MFLGFTGRLLEYGFGVALGFMFVQRDRKNDDSKFYKFGGSLILLFVTILFFTTNIKGATNFIFSWSGNGLFLPLWGLMIYCFALEKDIATKAFSKINFLGNGALAAYILQHAVE